MSRDTDTDWQVKAEREPYHGVLTNSGYLAENLTPERIEEFYRSGRENIAGLLATIRRVFGGFAPQSALDFGCGVGRQTFAMAEHAGMVLGVDIAPAMIAHAEKRRAEIGLENVSFRRDLPDAPCDWINSHIVFQHIPPESGYALLGQLLGILVPGGIASLHFRIYQKPAGLTEVCRNVDAYRQVGNALELFRPEDRRPAGSLTMYDYDLNRLFVIFVQHGLNDFHISHVEHAKGHGILLFARKSRT